MARRKTKVYYSEDKIYKANIVHFFYKEYAARKFILDCNTGVVDAYSWDVHVSKIIQFVGYIIIFEYSPDDAMENITDDGTMNEVVHELFEDNIDKIFEIVNAIIVAYHKRNNTNPKYDYAVEYCDKFSECIINSAIEKIENSILFIRNVCVNYGYFPKELMSRTDPYEIMSLLCEDKKFPYVETFIFIPQDEEGCVFYNYTSKSGECYFEKESPDKYYFYCNTSNETFDINDTIRKIKVCLSIKPSKRLKKSININDSSHNLQICINKRHNKFDIKYVLENIKYNIKSTQLYFEPEKYLFNSVSEDLYWHVLDVKHLKGAFVNRSLGLFIWECKYIDNKKLANCINGVLDARDIKILNYFLVKNAHDEQLYKVLQHALANPELRNEQTKAISNLYLNFFDKKRKNIGNYPEYYNLVREYCKAKISIQTLKILP